MAYQDADWDSSSTAVLNGLHVAFNAALLTVVFMEEALRRMVKVTVINTPSMLLAGCVLGKEVAVGSSLLSVGKSCSKQSLYVFI